MWKINENDWKWSIGISPMITPPFSSRIFETRLGYFCDDFPWRFKVSPFVEVKLPENQLLPLWRPQKMKLDAVEREMKGMIGMSPCLTLNAHSAAALRPRWIWCSLPFGASEAETFRNSFDVETLEDFGSGFGLMFSAMHASHSLIIH